MAEGSQREQFVTRTIRGWKNIEPLKHGQLVEALEVEINVICMKREREKSSELQNLSTHAQRSRSLCCPLFFATVKNCWLVWCSSENLKKDIMAWQNMAVAKTFHILFLKPKHRHGSNLHPLYHYFNGNSRLEWPKSEEVRSFILFSREDM